MLAAEAPHLRRRERKRAERRGDLLAARQAVGDEPRAVPPVGTSIGTHVAPDGDRAGAASALDRTAAGTACEVPERPLVRATEDRRRPNEAPDEPREDRVAQRVLRSDRLGVAAGAAERDRPGRRLAAHDERPPAAPGAPDARLAPADVGPCCDAPVDGAQLGPE